MKKFNGGFTFLELIVVVAIVGILVAIAYPSYMRQVMKGNRSDAKVKIADVAQQMQRCFTSQSTYNPSVAGVCKIKDNVTAGITSDNGFYTVKIAAADLTATTYIIKATPVGSKIQSKDTDCASIQIDQTGKKYATNSDGSTDTTATCW